MKIIRIFFQWLVFILFLSLSFYTFPKIIVDLILGTQIFPSFFRLILHGFSAISIILIFNIIFALFLGRFYCSFLCPLGILQDSIFSIYSFFKKNVKKFRDKNYYRKTLLISGGLFFIFLIASIFNLKVIISIMEPYSLFTKFVYIFDNILTDNIKDTFFYFIIILIILFVLKIFFEERFFCKYICPTGFLLRSISNFSLLNLHIDDNKCIKCKKCENVCKTSCITISKKENRINNSLCVRCFNCYSECPVNAISFSVKNGMNIQNLNRRKSLKVLGFSFILIFFSSLIKKANFIKNAGKNFKKNQTVPVGSNTLENYINRCINCNLCVNVCPTNVLQPNIQAPRLNYNIAFCDYFCNECSKVCPVNAIKYIPIQDKKKIAMGKSNLDKNLCVVYSKNQSCGACAEICPTGAVHLVNYKNNLMAPELDNKICVGCGSCEYACPTRPIRAIKVEPYNKHRKLKIEEQKTEKEVKTEEFPF